jgi:hypothetical protein
MIDVRTFLSLQDSDGVAAVEEEHREGLTRRGAAKALLLTELGDPVGLGRRIETDIDAEQELLAPILAHLEDLEAKRESSKRVVAATPDTSDDWVLSHPGFREQTLRILRETSAALESERERCRALVAARVAEKEAGLQSKDPSPQEEPDPNVRIWARRLRENEESSALAEQLELNTFEYKKRIAVSRKAFEQKRPKPQFGPG